DPVPFEEAYGLASDSVARNPLSIALFASHQRSCFTCEGANECSYLRQYSFQFRSGRREIANERRPLSQLACVAKELWSKGIGQCLWNFCSASLKCSGDGLCETRP